MLLCRSWESKRFLYPCGRCRTSYDYYEIYSDESLSQTCAIIREAENSAVMPLMRERGKQSMDKETNSLAEQFKAKENELGPCGNCAGSSWMPLILITTICMSFAWTIGCTAAMLIRHVLDMMNHRSISRWMSLRFIRDRSFRFIMILETIGCLRSRSLRSVRSKNRSNHASSRPRASSNNIETMKNELTLSRASHAAAFYFIVIQ